MSILNYVSMVSLRKKVPSEVVRGFLPKEDAALLFSFFLVGNLYVYTWDYRGRAFLY